MRQRCGRQLRDVTIGVQGIVWLIETKVAIYAYT